MHNLIVVFGLSEPAANGEAVERNLRRLGHSQVLREGTWVCHSEHNADQAGRLLHNLLVGDDWLVVFDAATGHCYRAGLPNEQEMFLRGHWHEPRSS